LKIVNDAIFIIFNNKPPHLAQQGILGNVSISNISGGIVNLIGYLTSSGSTNVNRKQSTNMLKEIYQNLFAKYNPFYFDLGFQFDMNSWIPIKLVAENNREENDPFQLIANGLKRNANELEVGSLVVITGK
jgi:hypothetical protein